MSFPMMPLTAFDSGGGSYWYYHRRYFEFSKVSLSYTGFYEHALILAKNESYRARNLATVR